MKKILMFCIALTFLYSNFAFAQAPADSSYGRKIDLIEGKIAKIKSLPKEEQKQYNTILSDVENRKNTLKALLKTPVAKRDKAWEESWNQNYSKATNKLDNIQVK